MYFFLHQPFLDEFHQVYVSFVQGKELIEVRQVFSKKIDRHRVG